MINAREEFSKLLVSGNIDQLLDNARKLAAKSKPKAEKHKVEPMASKADDKAAKSAAAGAALAAQLRASEEVREAKVAAVVQMFRVAQRLTA
jgi:hypothetical protein